MERLPQQKLSNIYKKRIIKSFFSFVWYNTIESDEMDIYQYIDNFGMYSFKEKEFNELDAAIFSYLSYASLDQVMVQNECTIREAGRIHIGTFKEKEFQMTAVKSGNKLLRYIKDTNRYRDCILKKYEYIGNDEMQFGVISIEYLPKKIFISFEGTNELVSGWKEDIMLSLHFPTVSHKKAVSYLNKNYSFKDYELIIGGHSKGGNLAVVAAMYANYFVRKKIKQVYSFEGPGLLLKEFYSKKYQKLEKKLFHYISNYSVVGLFFHHSNDIVVESLGHGISSHHLAYWAIEKDHFKKTTLSPFSKEIDKELKLFVQKYDDNSKMDFLNNFEDIMKKAGANTLLDLGKDYKKVIKLVYETKGLTQNTKNMMFDLVNIMVRCYKEDITWDVKNKISKTKKTMKSIHFPKWKKAKDEELS